jgi:prophage regulatory protein
MELKTLLRLKKVLAHTGDSRSTHYLRIQQGLMPKHVSLGGGYAVAWPADEIAAIINARIAGQSDEQIKALVKMLEQARQANA